MSLFKLVVLIFVIYFFFTTCKETFTDVQNDLASKLQTYLISQQTNYIGFANILNNNKNTSTNLSKISTYKSLVQLGPAVTITDVLQHF